MEKKVKIGILDEKKFPPDKRVALTPNDASYFLDEYKDKIELYIESSSHRCFSDDEYEAMNLTVVNDISHCDLLLGVKEIPIDNLYPDKSYMFFSHTAKKQPYNRDLLREILNKKITLIDYEYLTDDNGARLIAFSRWAGIIGCYNGIKEYGNRYNLFDLKPAYYLKTLKDLYNELSDIDFPAIKIAISGNGRAGRGAAELLRNINIKQVSPEEYLNKEFQKAVFCILTPEDYVKRKDKKSFTLQNFIDNPEEFEPNFFKYAKETDLFISSHYWDPKSPVLISREDILSPDFNISVIADVTCDIRGSITSTLRATTLEQPVYGYDPHTDKETSPYDPNAVTVMAVDTLPGELPREASLDFSSILVNKILPYLIDSDSKGIIKRATIASEGNLTENFSYLQDFVDGKE